MKTCFPLIVLALLVPITSSVADEGKGVSWETLSPRSPLAETIDLEEPRTLVLANRGTIRTTKKVEKCRVGFEWTWVEGQLPQYPDCLTVVLRTTGERTKWPFEMKDGVFVRLNPAAKGFVIIEQRESGKDFEPLAKSKSFEFKKGTSYSVKITDSGDGISVSIDGTEVLTAKLEGGPASGVVAVYNREPVAGIRKVSKVKGLRLEELKPKP